MFCRARRDWRTSFDLSAACGIVRPLNFTVRGHERTSRGFAVSGSARPCSQPCAELGPFSRHPSSDTGATAQAVSLGGYGCVLDALHGSHALPWSTVSDLDLWGTVQ